MPDSGIREVTEPIELAIVDDRLQFTITSGTRKRTYSASFHKCRNAATAACILLDQHDAGQARKVLPFEKRR